jgi:histone H3/H4
MCNISASKENKLSLIKASAIKKQIRDAGYRVSKETFAQFERKLALAVQNAIEAANADKRKTVQPSDVY